MGSIGLQRVMWRKRENREHSLFGEVSLDAISFTWGIRLTKIRVRPDGFDKDV